MGYIAKGGVKTMKCVLFGHKDASEKIKAKIKKYIIDILSENESVEFFVGNNGSFDSMAQSVLEDLSSERSELKYLIYLLNIGRDKALYHSGITPKNIIVDKNGKFSSFIDIDSVNVCSKEYAFQMMATKYQELGFDISDLITYYRNTTHDLLQEKSIQRKMNLLASGKKLLWKMSQKRKTK